MMSLQQPYEQPGAFVDSLYPPVQPVDSLAAPWVVPEMADLDVAPHSIPPQYAEDLETDPLVVLAHEDTSTPALSQQDSEFYKELGKRVRHIRKHREKQRSLLISGLRLNNPIPSQHFTNRNHH